MPDFARGRAAFLGGGSRLTLISLSLLGILWVFRVNAWAGGRSVGEEEACLGSWLASLSASPSCRASYTAEREAAGAMRICLGDRDWGRLLAEGKLPEGCALWQGQWRWPATPFLEGGRETLIISVANAPRAGVLRLGLERLRARLGEDLAPRDPLGVCRSLLLGETAGGSAPGMLRRLGFVHLLSASGIHLYALADLVSFGVVIMATRIGLPALHSRILARLLAGALWLFCWGLSGARPGMARPLLLVSLRKTAEGAGIAWRPYASLVAALGIDLAIGVARGEPPGSALGYGLAVTGGTAGLYSLRGGRGFRSHLALACGSWVFLALLEAWQEATLALATPLLSLVTLPLFSLAAYPLLTVAAGAGALGWHGLSAGLCAITAESATIATAALARFSMCVPSLWVIPKVPLLLGCALAGPVALLSRRALAFCVPLALALRLVLVPWGSLAGSESDAPASELRQLAVGQGDSALVESASGHAGLIDSGSEHAVLDSRWIGWLARSGITRLDWVALTHFDEDHAGGLHSLLRLLPVGCVESAEAQWSAPRGRALERRVAEAGAKPMLWGSGCVPYPTLAPPSGSRHSANAAMGAVWVPLQGGVSYLSAGDATAEDEPRIGGWARALSDRWGARERILKVSHHGSRTSSSPLFLSEFAPTELWISVGRGNLYGHPNAEVLARLEGLGVPVRRTDLEGELRATGDRRRR